MTEKDNTMKITTQDLFNTVVTGLYKQGKCSVSGNGNCMYRGLNGAKCAVGMLIKDEYYDPELENLDAGNTNVGLAIQASIGRELSKQEKDLLNLLQGAHDDLSVADFCYLGVDVWREKIIEGLTAIAREYGLTMPSLSQE